MDACLTVGALFPLPKSLIVDSTTQECKNDERTIYKAMERGTRTGDMMSWAIYFSSFQIIGTLPVENRVHASYLGAHISVQLRIRRWNFDNNVTSMYDHQFNPRGYYCSPVLGLCPC